MSAPRKLGALISRVPRWDPAALARRPSPFTGESEHTILWQRADGLCVRECPASGGYYVDPAPTPTALAELYASYFREFRSRGDLLDPETLAGIRGAQPVDDARILTLDGLSGGLRRKRALDVGFGLGHNLVRLRKAGAVVDGMDLDSDAITLAKDVAGVEQAWRDDFATTTIDLPPYDLVTMYDLVEHPLEPLSLFERAFEALRPGGLLAIDTPNATFARRDAEPELFMVDYEHMQYFSAATVVFVAHQMGWRLMHLEQRIQGPNIPSESSANGGGAWVAERRRRALAWVRATRAARPLLALRRGAQQHAQRRGRYALFAVLQKPYGG